MGIPDGNLSPRIDRARIRIRSTVLRIIHPTART
jgi:hypothetical protein